MSHAINKLCTKCGACLPECPTGSIIEGSDHFIIDADTCMDHKACVNVCPVDAIAPIAGNAGADAWNRRDEEEEEQ